MTDRKPDEVPFSGQQWLKRYHDQHKWNSLREELVLQDVRYHFPHDWERLVENAKEHGAEIVTGYCAYMWINDPWYQDELPVNEWLVNRTPGEARRLVAEWREIRQQMQSK